jgi:AcrR family transcriptional regulator
MPRAEREDEMLRAAGDAFARFGFHGASMDAIAQAAGISKPMLYNYFGSKQGLYAAYIAEELSGLRERVTEMLTTLFGDEAFAHAFAGAGESLAGWWLGHPEQPKERMASILMDVAQSAPTAPAAPARRRR